MKYGYDPTQQSIRAHPYSGKEDTAQDQPWHPWRDAFKTGSLSSDSTLEAHRAHLDPRPSVPSHFPHLVGLANAAGWAGCTRVMWELVGFLQFRLQLCLSVWLGGSTRLGNFDFSPFPQRFSISVSNPASIQYPSEI